ncbi:MAG TPA: 30S ribosomal protein THX [Pyrinomonadaceae bacterium]|jgi:30S ribosomal protein S31
MGKGDKRTRRGKISAGSFGKTRPKYKKDVYVPSGDSGSTEAAAPKERKPKVRKKSTDEQAAA